VNEPAAPSVEVLIPTHNRPELVRRAVESVRAQRYDGRLGVAVIFDRAPEDPSMAAEGTVPVRVLTNTRTPGLAGARNSGIVSSSADFVAFLDDDDHWLPDKLARQMRCLRDVPGAEFATTAINVEFEDRVVPRRAELSAVTHFQLLESRMAMLHSSTFLTRRSSLLGGIGLVNEDAPQSQNEDWDLLLRASARHDIVHVDEPLVAVRWGTTSLFARAWQSRIAAAQWILDQHPDIRDSPRGYARLLGQIAFAHAAIGERRAAAHWAIRATRLRWREPRAYLSAMVAIGIVNDSTVLRFLHRRGKGI
jgi:glycosyltransferase involved in cell wall biosynthesis